MPIRKVKGGFKWGGKGKVYPTHAGAARQAAAAHANGFVGDAGNGEKILKPVRPNAGIAALYRRKLDALIVDMHNSVEFWLKATYRKNMRMALDGNPTTEIQATLNQITKQWEVNFSDGANQLARWFAQSTRSYSDGTLAHILHEVGFGITFKMTKPMQTTYAAVVNENVHLIKSIAQHHLGQVNTLVMQSIAEGRNLGDLTAKIEHQYGLTRKRAALIARDQNNKATSNMNRTRQREIGITEAIWKHSHGGKEPRPSHLAADGKRYNIDKGMFLDGKWVHTGEEINCRCISQPIIKGFKY